MSKRFVVYVTMLLLLIAGLTSWYTMRIVKGSTKIHISKPHNPDSFMIKVLYTQMNQDGKISMVIYSPTAKHYSYQNSTLFQQPKITVMRSNQAPWLISSKYGTSKHGNDVIQLKQKVKLHQNASAHNRQLTITTTSVTIYPHRKTIITKQPVTIKQPGLIITAVGATTNLNNRTTKLLSQVRLAQGTSRLQAQQLVSYSSKDSNKIYKIVASGNRAHYSTLPDGKKYRLNAKANVIEYYPLRKVAVLIGDAAITQHQNKFSGQRIIYNTKKQIIEAASSNNNKTTIVLQP